MRARLVRKQSQQGTENYWLILEAVAVPNATFHFSEPALLLKSPSSRSLGINFALKLSYSKSKALLRLECIRSCE
jgi:hypothetical protein